jgi:hypothetical protein
MRIHIFTQLFEEAAMIAIIKEYGSPITAPCCNVIYRSFELYSQRPSH